MAQFRGTLQGNRGQASRLGTKKSGLIVTANGWDIGVSVRLFHDKLTGEDRITVYRNNGSNDGNIQELVYSNKSERNPK